MGVAFVEEKGKLVGIISNADVRKGLLKVVKDLNALNALDLINESPKMISSEANVNELLEYVRAIDFPIMYLPVVSAQGELLGAVTFLDLVKGE